MRILGGPKSRDEKKGLLKCWRAFHLSLERYAEVDDDGTYFIDNLTRGKYTLRVQVANSSHIVRPDDLWSTDEIMLDVQGGETTIANFDVSE